MKVTKMKLRADLDSEYFAEIDYVWMTFSDINKDKALGLTSDGTLDDFLQAAKKIDPAIHNIVKMLTKGF